jgi:hypothetical protein
MSALKLIGAAAFRPFRNVWMLEELGVAYEHIAARPRAPEAQQVNPFGKVPCLMDGDFAMYESVAINTYLGDKFRGQPDVPQTLLPPPGTPALRATLLHAALRARVSARTMSFDCPISLSCCTCTRDVYCMTFVSVLTRSSAALKHCGSIASTRARWPSSSAA